MGNSKNKGGFSLQTIFYYFIYYVFLKFHLNIRMQISTFARLYLSGIVLFIKVPTLTLIVPKQYVDAMDVVHSTKVHLPPYGFIFTGQSYVCCLHTRLMFLSTASFAPVEEPVLGSWEASFWQDKSSILKLYI